MCVAHLPSSSSSSPPSAASYSSSSGSASASTSPGPADDILYPPPPAPSSSWPPARRPRLDTSSRIPYRCDGLQSPPSSLGWDERPLCPTALFLRLCGYGVYLAACCWEEQATQRQFQLQFQAKAPSCNTRTPGARRGIDYLVNPASEVLTPAQAPRRHRLDLDLIPCFGRLPLPPSNWAVWPDSYYYLSAPYPLSLPHFTVTTPPTSHLP
jgi:hypothetical protein